MIQPQQQASEKDRRIDSINSALNTITNLQTQLNGMSSQLSMYARNVLKLPGAEKVINTVISILNKIWEHDGR